MAIGTAAAIGLGLTAVGGVMSAKSQSKAAGRAANVSEANNERNIALARENRDMLLNRADPFIQSGAQANALMNDFLGFGQPARGQAQAAPTALYDKSGGGMPAGYGYGLGDGFSGYNPSLARDISPQVGRNALWGGAPQAPGVIGGFGGGTYDMNGNQVTPNSMGQGGVSAKDAFAKYIDNSDYAFQFGEGSNAINSGYAGAGTLQSGAAMKALEGYRQNLQSGYRNEWANRVAGQQATGMNALGAAAGVGMGSTNQMINSNTQNAANQANALLMKGANNPLANAFGMIGGGIWGATR